MGFAKVGNDKPSLFVVGVDVVVTDIPEKAGADQLLAIPQYPWVALYRFSHPNVNQPLEPLSGVASSHWPSFSCGSLISAHRQAMHLGPSHQMLIWFGLRGQIFSLASSGVT